MAGGASAAMAVTSDYLDTSKDNAISPLDAMLVINYLNAQAAGLVSSDSGFVLERGSADAAQTTAEGEGASGNLAEIVSLLAADSAEEAARKRRR